MHKAYTQHKTKLMTERVQGMGGGQRGTVSSLVQSLTLASPTYSVMICYTHSSCELHLISCYCTKVPLNTVMDSLKLL